MSAKPVQRKGRPARKRGWKDIQSQKGIRRRNKLALSVLAIIAAILLLSQAVKFTQMLFNPWRQEPLVKRTVLWNGDFNLNILIKAKGISLLSFNPQERKITVIDMPDQTYLEAAHGYGKWQLGSVYGLGESQKEVGGGKLLEDTLENLFGLPVDAFLDFSGKYSEKGAIDILAEIRGNPLSILSILSNLSSDLTPFELIRFNLGAAGVRFDKIRQIDLEMADDVLQKEKLLDGTDILVADTIKLDSKLSSILDPAVKSEHKTIAIFNSTDHPGLAQKAARLITNIGGDVIVTSNGKNKYEKTQIFGEKSKTLDRLKQIFEPGGIIDPQDWDLVSSRAQINLFLGEDYFDNL